MLIPHKVAAKAWDDYMNRFGIEAYVVARYFSGPTATHMNGDAPRKPPEAASLRHPPSLGASIPAVNQ